MRLRTETGASQLGTLTHTTDATKMVAAENGPAKDFVEGVKDPLKHDLARENRNEKVAVHLTLLSLSITTACSAKNLANFDNSVLSIDFAVAGLKCLGFVFEPDYLESLYTNLKVVRNVLVVRHNTRRALNAFFLSHEIRDVLEEDGSKGEKDYLSGQVGLDGKTRLEERFKS